MNYKEGSNIFQLNKILGDRTVENQLDFSAIRDRAQVTRTISRIRSAQTRIAVTRSLIASASARTKIAKCRNRRARTREWLVK